ncbi:mucin-associated surface protein (MASP), putative [Trypanosoma cruzi marinkellei]|uniref:Mucin-associated surface protein (MASP), putative n=1 Tax=Trypanosoma cruzi marinkellei TaxID=85056 RepID=K2N3S2_TRYCR|nr:mucin-associated surface protein (MASP), putative [Trypanosoma cruzi marinkellei]
MVCVRCRCWAAAICDCAVAVRGVAAVSLVLLPRCVDGELVCAGGCTQVTGVMAMMMTGRVLLVCALCVLWCGDGGVDASNLDNNAVGGCMASRVLTMNKLYTPSGCDKTVLTLPLRYVLSITAVEASTDPVVTDNADNKSVLTPSSVAASGGAGSPPRGDGGEGGGDRDGGVGSPGGVGGASDSQAPGSQASAGGGESDSSGAGPVDGPSGFSRGSGGDPNGRGGSTLKVPGPEAGGREGVQGDVQTGHRSIEPPS